MDVEFGINADKWKKHISGAKPRERTQCNDLGAAVS
jgi:hypothetical protein